jgi:protein-S-isoprenylcysteine O-methyltransferase Ste14
MSSYEQPADRSALTRCLFLTYGTLCYAGFLGVFLYFIGFMGNVAVPKGIDDGAAGPVQQAVLINVGILGAFAVQHLIMAREWFKRRFTKIVPKPIERSTFVLIASSIVATLCWQWRPLPEIVWNVENEALRMTLHVICASGWATVLISTFLIDHFDLFGMRQVWLAFRNKPYTGKPFMTRGLYKLVRHPLMTGFLIAFWATPTMSVGHLLFAVVTSAYVSIGVRVEERTLVAILGQDYVEYAKVTPRFWPSLRRLPAATPAAT